MIKNNIFIGLILSFAIIAQLSLSSGADWLQYAKPEVESGQWWRFITGNFIHLNWRHFTLNAFALIVIIYLFPKILFFRELLLVLLLCCLSVTIGLWIFFPSIYWYVGLSGALHGLLVTMLFLDLAAEKSALNIGLLVLLLVKLIWEIQVGPLPGSEVTAGGSVVVEAHILGSSGGIVLAICFLSKKYLKNKNISA